MIDFNTYNICCNKKSKFLELIKEDKNFLNKKRERTNDCTIEDKSTIEIDFVPKIEFKFPEINGLKNLKDDYIYVGCEDGNIKLVKLKNESIVSMFFK